MSPDKTRQIGNDLACLAASIAGIAEELMAMLDHEAESTNAAQPSPGPQAAKAPALEEVRAYLADKSRAGHTAAVREILLKHGANRLSEVDPADYAAVLADARALG